MALLLSSRWCRRLACLACLAASLALFVGCNPDPYPADLEYPARSDVLAIDAVKWSEPSGIDQPGEFNHFFADIKTLIQLDPKREKATDALPPRLAALREKKVNAADPDALPAPVRARFYAWMRNIFGTPAHPNVRIDEENDPEGADLVQAIGVHDAAQLANGSTLYRRHCLHCHGVPGDGRGPTAAWVQPHPRDYRQGLFKFISASEGNKPLRADLRRTLVQGIEGTSMPNFKLLSGEEIDALVSYVIHLSIRGEVEFEVLKAWVAPGASLTPKDNDPVNEADVGAVDTYRRILEKWARAGRSTDVPLGRLASTEQVPMKPKPYPEALAKASPEQMKDSVKRGYDLFLGKGLCISCHLDFGRQASWKYDEWGTIVRPANLTTGVYRGGRRPVDFYYRIHAGIPPSGMSPGTALSGSGEEMWDLVNFVQALPYPGMLPDDVRHTIYPETNR